MVPSLSGGVLLTEQASGVPLVVVVSGLMFSTEAIMSDVEVFSDRSELIHAEAERIVTQATDAIRTRGRCLVALSGSSTPRPLYELLATSPYAATAAVGETHRWAMAAHVEKPRAMWRVTLTTVVLNAAADVTLALHWMTDAAAGANLARPSP
jgi:6-phosphogluconolactonase/glucosamine-6-phosphate isomerase/deaminase